MSCVCFSLTDHQEAFRVEGADEQPTGRAAVISNTPLLDTEFTESMLGAGYHARKHQISLPVQTDGAGACEHTGRGVASTGHLRTHVGNKCANQVM